MAKYLTQGFAYSERVKMNGLVRITNGNAIFWAVQDEANHAKSNEFSRAAQEWLMANTSWPRDRIRAGKLRSGQPDHAAGKELRWNGRKWVKA